MQDLRPASTAALALMLAVLTPGLASAQTSSAGAAKAYKVPRTPDGKPDFQGYWTNLTLTPLERPKALGTKEFYTAEEVAAAKKKESSRLARDLEEGLPTEKGTAADVHYDYAQYGLDKAQSTEVWDRRTSLIVGPEGTLPPLLPQARQRAAAIAAKARGHEFDGPENRPLSARCLVLGYEQIPMLPAGYNNNIQIVQGAGFVSILHEMNHSVRLIPTDGRPHLAPGVSQWRGDSRGHWEGDTLVVDVTNFDARNPFRGSSDQLHVIERFTRVAADTILYRFTVDDPETWGKPWSAEVAMDRTPGPIYEFACNEGNYEMANTLNAARVAEKKAAEKAH